MKYKQTLTAKEVKEIGTIVYDVFDEGLRFIIMRGPYHWCGYVGIPEEHPLAGFDYETISFVSAHGGLTYSKLGGKEGVSGSSWPKGYWWYGWDYGHSGDYSHFEKMPDRKARDDKDGTIKEVIDDSWEALHDFKKLMKFTEEILKKSNLVR